MQRAVDHETGDVRDMRPVIDDLAVDIQPDQVRRGDLVVAQTIRIDQEVPVVAVDRQRRVRVDQLGPAEMIHHPVAGGELYPLRPFLRADPVA